MSGPVGTVTPFPTPERASYRGIKHTAAAEHERLGRAVAVLGARCEGDQRFTNDSAPLDALRPLCAACPVFVLCAKYATAARPIAGVWAGERYGVTGEPLQGPTPRDAPAADLDEAPHEVPRMSAD